MNFQQAINHYLYEGKSDFPYHDTLYSKLWSNYKINEEIRNKLLKIAKDACNEDIKIHVKDIILTGSICDFNYTRQSDIDLHLIVDIASIPTKDREFAEDYLDKRRKLWSEDHEIEIYGHDVEIYFQPHDIIHHANGIFSLLYNKWLKIPKHTKPNINHNLIDFKYHKISSFIGYLKDKLASYPNESRKIHEKAKKTMEKIKKYRDDGLKSNKEIFSSGNLLFKKLRNKGDIQKLSDIINKSYDNLYSITLNPLNEVYVPKRAHETDYKVVANPDNRRRRMGLASPNKHKNVVLKATKQNNEENQKVFTLKKNGGGWFPLSYAEMMEIVIDYNAEIPQKGERKGISNAGVYLFCNLDGDYFVAKDKNKLSVALQ